jgi:hypothetical protein
MNINHLENLCINKAKIEVFTTLLIQRKYNFSVVADTEDGYVITVYNMMKIWFDANGTYDTIEPHTI